jgi:hypothetical protein
VKQAVRGLVNGQYGGARNTRSKNEPKIIPLKLWCPKYAGAHITASKYGELPSGQSTDINKTFNQCCNDFTFGILNVLLTTTAECVDCWTYYPTYAH